MNHFFKISRYPIICLLVSFHFTACKDSNSTRVHSKTQTLVSKKKINCLLDNATIKAKSDVNAIFTQISCSKKRSEIKYNIYIGRLLAHSSTPYPHSNLMIGLFLEELQQNDKSVTYYQKEIDFYKQIFVDSSLSLCDEVAYPFIETAASAYLFLNDENGFVAMKRHLSSSSNLNIQNHIDLIPKNKKIAKELYGI